MGQPNNALREARLAMLSPSGSGASMSRSELAKEVNTHIHQITDRCGILNSNYLGKLERGVIRWPNPVYRCALRAALGVCHDSDLGFVDT